MTLADSTAPDWYLSMDQFLTLVNEVVKSSRNDWAFAGRNIHDKAHPEDLAIGVVAAAEMVSLTLTALGHVKPHLFQDPEKPKKK